MNLTTDKHFNEMAHSFNSSCFSHVLICTNVQRMQLAGRQRITANSKNCEQNKSSKRNDINVNVYTPICIYHTYTVWYPFS